MKQLTIPAAVWVTFALLIVAGCSKDDEPTSSGESGITSAAFPNNTANLTLGGGATLGALTGGTSPYMITSAPDTSVATASMLGPDTLSITPVGVGSTSVTIEDSSPSAGGDSPSGATVTISINVTEETFAGSGSFSLSTSAGSFSATGTYNESAASGQGVGGLRTTEGTDEVLYVVAYNARSVSDADLVLLMFHYPGGTLMPGTYDLLPLGAEYASIGFGFHLNLANQNPPLYIGTMGSVNLATISQTAATGNTIVGSAVNSANPTQTATFSEGTFNVSGVGQGRPAPEPDSEIRDAVMRILRHMSIRSQGD